MSVVAAEAEVEVLSEIVIVIVTGTEFPFVLLAGAVAAATMDIIKFAAVDRFLSNEAPIFAPCRPVECEWKTATMA